MWMMLECTSLPQFDWFTWGSLWILMAWISILKDVNGSFKTLCVMVIVLLTLANITKYVYGDKDSVHRNPAAPSGFFAHCSSALIGWLLALPARLLFDSERQDIYQLSVPLQQWNSRGGSLPFVSRMAKGCVNGWVMWGTCSVIGH